MICAIWYRLSGRGPPAWYKPGQVAGQHRLAQPIQAIGVGRRADFVEIERGRLRFLEARLNPIDRAGVAVEADAHRQRNPQRAGRRAAACEQLLRRRPSSCRRRSPGRSDRPRRGRRCAVPEKTRSIDRCTNRAAAATARSTRLRTPSTLIRQAIAGSSSHAFSAQLPAQSSTAAKRMLVEQPRQAVAIFGVAGHDAWPVEPPVVALADADHLAGIPGLEIGQRVVARHAGDAGDQQRQAERQTREVRVGTWAECQQTNKRAGWKRPILPVPPVGRKPDMSRARASNEAMRPAHSRMRVAFAGRNGRASRRVSRGDPLAS